MRWWMILLLALAALTVIVRVITARSTVLQSKFIRLLCSLNAGARPKNFDEVLAAIDTLAEDVSYESAFENGVLDVYAAKGDAKLPLIVDRLCARWLLRWRRQAELCILLPDAGEQRLCGGESQLSPHAGGTVSHADVAVQ